MDRVVAKALLEKTDEAKKDLLKAMTLSHDHFMHRVIKQWMTTLEKD